MSDAMQHKPGDVFQINERHGRNGWIGALLLAEYIKNWGVVGFLQVVKTHDENARMYIRLPWHEIDYIGHAALLPSDFEQSTTAEHTPRSTP